MKHIHIPCVHLGIDLESQDRYCASVVKLYINSP